MKSWLGYYLRRIVQTLLFGEFSVLALSRTNQTDWYSHAWSNDVVDSSYNTATI